MTLQATLKVGKIGRRYNMWFDDVYNFFRQLKIKYPHRDFCFCKLWLYNPHTYYLKTTIFSDEGYLTFVFDASTLEITEEYME